MTTQRPRRVSRRNEADEALDAHRDDRPMHERDESYPHGLDDQPATKPQGHKPTPQQQVVIDWGREGRGNVFVEAVAGSGKSTTLLAACRYMTPPPGSKWWSVKLVSFNKKIATDLTEKLLKLRESGINIDHIEAGTFHKFAFRAWRKSNPKVQLLKDRPYYERMYAENAVEEEFHGIVQKLVGLAMSDAVCAAWQPEDTSQWMEIVEHHDLLESMVDPTQIDKAIQLARRCIKWARSVGPQIINFNSMLWLPTVTDCKVWESDRVLVDEAQDTNRVRRLFARKMLKRTGRIAFVGDRHQAIYGFTGADNDAIDQIIREFNCKQLPLTVSFRCPQSVVREAQRFVSHIQAHESAPEGEVSHMARDVFRKDGFKQLTPQDAILCRNTKPLVALAFWLLRNGVACFVEGKEIGQGILALLGRWKTVKSVSTLGEKLRDYRDKQVTKLMGQKKETQAEQLNDRVETLLVLMEGCDTLECVKAKVDNIFKDRLNPDGTENTEVRNAVCLCTVHRSKGLEWPTVYILGFERYMPSKWAQQEWQQEQERNLQYVSITRAQAKLVYLEALEDQRPRAA